MWLPREAFRTVSEGKFSEFPKITHLRVASTFGSGPSYL
jgi:hypothetical protein